jgi:hypothetical protein
LNTTLEQRFIPGADDASDVCRQERAALERSGDYFSQSLMAGAVEAAKKLLQDLKKGQRPDSRTIVVGAATTTITGVATGYWLKQREQSPTEQALLAAILKDLRQENEQIDRTQAALDALVRCRRREADIIRADLTAGRVDRPEAQTRMAAVRQRYEQDLEIARNISGRVMDRGANFQFANEQVNPQPYLAVRDAVLRKQAIATAPQVGRLVSGTLYSASRADDNWFKVYLPNRTEGFVEVAVLNTPPPRQPAGTMASAPQPAQKPQSPQKPQPGKKPQPAQKPQPTQTIPPADPQREEINESTSTNVAKRDRLAESIQIAADNTSAFEITSG